MTLLDDFDEGAGFGQAVVGAGVEPGEAALQGLYLQVLLGEVLLVDGGDFQFTAGTGLDVLGYLYHAVRIEVEADDGIVALGLCRLLFDAEAVAFGVELSNTVAFGVVDKIAEDGSLAVLLGGTYTLAQQLAEACSVEDVVAQDQTGTVVADELFTDDESLSQSVGRGLLGVFEVEAIVAAVAQQTLETWQVVGGGDDENLTDACQHQYGYRVVDHGFVEDGNQLFADALRDGI